MDNASNNDTFVRELASLLKKSKDIAWNSERLRFRCFSHILNLAGQATLNEMKDEIDKVLIVLLYFFLIIIYLFNG
jgi:hypothetical protein